MRLLFTISAIFLSIFTFSQNVDWNYTYGGSETDIINSVVEAKDGGYFIIGYSNSENGDIKDFHKGYDFWVAKINKDGIIEWETTLGGSSDYDFAVDAAENHKGELLVVGSSFSNDGDRTEKHCIGSDDIWLAALGKDGKLLWHKTYGGSLEDKPTDMIALEDGSMVILSTTKSKDNHIKSNNGKRDLWLVKVKHNGKIQWSHNYGGTRNEHANKIIATSDKGFLISAETESRNGDVKNRKSYQYDAWIIKTDHKGRVQWQKTYGGSKDDNAKTVIELMNGGYIIAGETESDDGHIKSPKGAFDIWVWKIDNSGNLIWEKTYGGKNIDFVTSMIQDPVTSTILIYGGTTSKEGDPEMHFGSTDTWLLGIDDEGRILSNQSFGGTNIDEPKDIIIDKRGNILLAATSLSENGDIDPLRRCENEDIWITKILPQNEIAVENHIQEDLNCMIKTYSSGYMMFGQNIIDPKNKNILLTNYDASGTQQFKREWKTNGHDNFAKAIKSNDGTVSYFAIGTTESSDTIFTEPKGKKDVFFQKLTDNGEVKMNKIIGGTNDDEGVDILQMNKKDLLLIMNTRSTNGDFKGSHRGDKDIWIAKTDKIGKIDWEKNYGGFGNDVATKGLLTYRKEIVIVGHSNSSDADIKHSFGNKDAIFLLLDKDGEIQAQSNFGGNGVDWFNDIIQAPDGSFIMVGGTKSNDISDKIKGGSDFYVVKTTPSGKVIWEKTFGGSNNEDAVSIIAHSREEFIIAGTSDSDDGDVRGNRGGKDVWVIKIDAQGKLIDQKTFGRTGHEVCRSMIKLSNSKYMVGGYELDDTFNKKLWSNDFRF